VPHDQTQSPKGFVICLGTESDIKRASLYFDYLLPICVPDQPRGHYAREETARNYVFPAEIVPDYFRYMSSERSHFTIPTLDNGGVAIACADALLWHLGHLYHPGQGYDPEFTPSQLSHLRPHLNRLISSVTPGQGSLLLPHDAQADNPQGTDESLGLVLAGLPLASVDNASWQQICEFRADREAIDELRKFRRHVTRLLRSAPPKHVAEDIEIAIKQQEKALAKWGLDSVLGSFELQDKLPGLAAAGTAAVSFLEGNETLEAAALALAASSIAIHVARRHQALTELRQECDVLYLSRVSREFR
jgi:hypothetical protein